MYKKLLNTISKTQLKQRANDTLTSQNWVVTSSSRIYTQMEQLRHVLQDETLCALEVLLNWFTLEQKFQNIQNFNVFLPKCPIPTVILVA